MAGIALVDPDRLPARAHVLRGDAGAIDTADARGPFDVLESASVDLDDARSFVRENHRGVLATRHGGRIQQSPVLVNVDGEGRAIVSSRETAYKVRNLRREPWAQACVFTDGFFGRWLFFEGHAEALSLPEAMDPLIAT